MKDNIIINEIMYKDDFLNLLSNYYRKKFKKDIKVTTETNNLYQSRSESKELIFLYKINELGKTIKVILTYNEIYEAIEDYVNNQGYILDSFEYDITNKADSIIFNSIKISFHSDTITLIKKLFKRR